jgi:rhamnogalacturonyl hydrolase YesR
MNSKTIKSSADDIFSNHKTKTPREIAVLIADRYISFGYPPGHIELEPTEDSEQKFYRCLYPTGVALWSLCHVYDLTNDTRYLDFVEKSYDFYLSSQRIKSSSIDEGGAIAHALLELHKLRSKEPYLQALREITYHYEHKAPRLLDQSFCFEMETWRRRTWLDALFMLCPLLAKSAGLLSEPQRHDDVLRQFFNYTVRLQDPEKCLYHQGWGWGINRTTHSPGFWSRANGWLSLAFVEVLKTIPYLHPGWDRLLELYQNFCRAVRNSQGASCRWHQLLTHPDSFEETSGTAMFIYSFLEGANQGWLDETYKECALRGFESLKGKIDIDGNIYGTCIGTSTQDTLEDYYRRETPVNDWHGQGPVILAACAAASA